MHPTRPREFTIISEDINSFTVTWNDPTHAHGTIDHFNVSKHVDNVKICILLFVVICSCITMKPIA